ncbi:MAG: hypothetical protein EB072_15365 [Betaproteobacteria bacterium]|nr:hypothetical protein [Betaproteobacteria bacterium]
MAPRTLGWQGIHDKWFFGHLQHGLVNSDVRAKCIPACSEVGDVAMKAVNAKIMFGPTLITKQIRLGVLPIADQGL